MKILHIIPRWIGGGPERGILEIARHDRDLPGAMTRRVVVLDTPVSAPLFVRARRLGVALVVNPPPEDLAREVADADIVEITYWNHPLLLDLLRRELPPTRLLVRSAIAGNTLPHILFPELVALADCWVLSAPPNHGRHPLGHREVHHIPALADMTRLADHAPRPHEGIRITYLGSLAATKLSRDFPTIVATTDHPGVTFDLYGDADEATIASLRQQLDARKAGTRVNFHGHVENIAQAFAETDIFAYPLAAGSYVTSEKALQEAMWVGLPPVLLAGTAATGWITHGVTGLVTHDCDEFAAALKRLAADAELRTCIGDAARAMARQRFDPQQNAAAMADVYARLAGRPKRLRSPLPGVGLPASERFLQSLGGDAGLFLHLLHGEPLEPAQGGSLNAEIILRGEGGVMHYAKSFPAETTLTQWAMALRKSW